MTTPIVDYTSREFASLRQDLIDLIPQFLPEWTNRSDNDFGMVLLDLFAYVGDGLHYYMDRVANEAYLDTASTRASVLKIAELLGYVPAGNQAAQTTLTLYNSAGSGYLVPAGTQVSTASSGSASPVVFETDSAVTVPASSSITVSAHEGVTVSGESLGTSDGSPSQEFPLLQTPVIDGSITVTVTEGITVTTWSEITHLIDALPDDQVFSARTDENGIVYLTFGDDVTGRIPNSGATLTVSYRVGGGSRGNVPANTLTRVLTSTIPATITVTNLNAATDGSDAESTDEIRRNAPAALQTLQRAATLEDYANLAITYPGVALAKATSSVPTAVICYIAPVGGGGMVSGSPTTTFAALETAVETFLQARSLSTVDVTVQGPTYVPINVSVDVNLLPNYSQSAASTACKKALEDLLSFENVVFGDYVTPTDVHTALAAVPGVDYITITLLDRGAGTGTGAVTLADSEVPVLGTTSFTLSGGIADS